MSDVRNQIRTRVLSEKLESSVIELDDGTKIEVRQTSVGQMLDTVNEADLKKRMARLLIDTCYVPSTDEKVFEEADFDVLMTLPSGGTYQKLIDAINKKMLPASLEEAGKD